MSPRRLRILAIIILGILVIGFILFVPRGTVQSPSVVSNAEDQAAAVIVSDSFKKGTHTITGSIEVRNACVGVAAEASVQGDPTQPAGILIAVTRTPTEGICLELPTKVTFQKKVSAPKGTPISATVDGKPASTTLQ